MFDDGEKTKGEKKKEKVPSRVSGGKKLTNPARMEKGDSAQA